jgi:hypothetical protein
MPKPRTETSSIPDSAPAVGNMAAMELAESRHIPLAALQGKYTLVRRPCERARSPSGTFLPSGNVRYRDANGLRADIRMKRRK